jgi:hypothetical protein
MLGFETYWSDMRVFYLKLCTYLWKLYGLKSDPSCIPYSVRKSVTLMYEIIVVSVAALQLAHQRTWGSNPMEPLSIQLHSLDTPGGDCSSFKSIYIFVVGLFRYFRLWVHVLGLKLRSVLHRGLQSPATH